MNKKENVNFLSPSKKQIDNLLEHYQNGRLSEAEKLAVSITQKFPQHQFSWKILGAVLVQIGRIGESLNAMQKAVQLSPQDAEAHNNLAIIFKKLGELEKAEVSYRKTIELNPDFAEAHYNLGNILKELGRLAKAAESYRQAIALNPEFVLAYSNLCMVLYKMGHKDLAMESIEKANHINPHLRDVRLLLSVIKSRKFREESESMIGDMNKVNVFKGLTPNPFILNRTVEAELIRYIRGMNSRLLDETKDARYGIGRCSLDFDLFDDSGSIIRKIEEDLKRIMMEAVKSDIYIYDSFFNILGKGGGSTPHKHLKEIDGDTGFNLDKQKYSLVYYLSVGDQTCSEPGILKLYDPVENILPHEGMIVIIPATREHSAIYNGKTDRIMIGVNFYSI